MRAASTVVVLGCVVDDLTTPSVQPSDVPLAVAGDSTVTLGDSTRLAATFTSGQGPYRVFWTSSDTRIADVDSAGWVMGRGAGTATVLARLEAPELVRPVEVEWPVRVRYAGVRVEPADSITGLGQTRQMVAVGVDARGADAGPIDASFSTADTAIVTVDQAGLVAARRNGTATVEASFDGLRSSGQIRVRQVAARITFASTPVAIPALGIDTSVALQVWDTGDSLIAAPGVTWSSSDPTAVVVTPEGTLRALRAASSIVTATVDTVTAQLPVSVAQVVSSLAITSVSQQAGIVGTAVSEPPAVVARDATGNPISGTIVVFSVASGSGVLADSVQITDASGIATLGSWTLGPAAGEQRVTAQASQAATEFRATALPGPISPNTSQLSLSADTLIAGASATATLSARDAFGNALTTGGAAVEFEVSGGGTGGFFDATVDHGDGTYTATFHARTSGATGLVGGRIDAATVTTAGAPVTVLPGGLANLERVAGDGQNAVVNTVVPVAPSVRATDEYDNPVGGVSVTFALTQGGGQLTGGGVMTGDDGVATVASWRYGTAVGAQQMQASAQAYSVAFTGTATHGPPSLTTSILTAAPDTIEAADSALVTLTLRDAFNNQVTSSGYAVAFGWTGGGSTGEIGTPQQDQATYRAHFRGVTAGTATTIVATVDGDSIASPRPSVTVTSGAVGSIQIVGGNGQTANAGTTLPIAPSVQVRDTLGNPIEGLDVTFVVRTGGGGVIGASQVTDASGVATLGSWTLGGAAGANTLDALAGGLDATFSATGVPGPASAAASTLSVSGTTVAAGSAVTVTLTARDQFGNPVGVGGANVAFSHQGGTSAGSFGAVTDVGDGTYTASFVGSTAGSATTMAATLNAASVTTPAPSVTVVAGAPAEFTIFEGDGQAATVGTAVATRPAVRVRDAFGNAVPALEVSFVVSGGGGSVTGATPDTDATGVARVGSWTLGTATGANTLDATISGFDVTFDATGQVGPASTATSVITVSQGTVQAGGTSALTLKTYDQYGNPLTTGGYTVVFSTQGGGSAGTISGTSDGSNGSYTATFTGTTAGSATILAASINGVNVTTAAPTITVQAGAPTQMVVYQGNNQSAPQGSSVPIAPGVRVTDAYDNPVPGVVVTFTPTQGNNTVTGHQPTTGANGVAIVGSWNFGALALGTQRMRASAPGLTADFVGNATLLGPGGGDDR